MWFRLVMALAVISLLGLVWLLVSPSRPAAPVGGAPSGVVGTTK